MSIKDALSFEKSWLGDIWKGIKNDPKRLILGVDPLSTKGWNAILGRNDKPVVGDFGGPTKDAYQHAQDKGIDTGTASTLHGIAKGVAAAYGLGGLANAGTGIANAANGGLGIGGGYTAAGAGTGAAGAVGAGVAGGAAEAIPEVVVSAGGGGGGAAAAGAGAATGGVAANGNGNGNGKSDNSFMQRLNKFGGQMQQQGQQQQMDEEKALDALARRGPPPNIGAGTNVGPAPVDQYVAATTPTAGKGIRGALG